MKDDREFWFMIGIVLVCVALAIALTIFTGCGVRTAEYGAVPLAGNCRGGFIHGIPIIDQPMRLVKCTDVYGRTETHYYDSAPETLTDKILGPVEGVTGRVAPAIPIAPIP